LAEWEQAGIIKEGSPTWTHPLVLVKKKALKPGDPPKYRICLDLRKLNEHVVIQAHPIPTFQRVVESFQGHSPVFMSLMDAQAGYLHCTSQGDSKVIQGTWYSNGLQDLRILALAVWTIGLSHGLSANYE